MSWLEMAFSAVLVAGVSASEQRRLRWQALELSAKLWHEDITTKAKRASGNMETFEEVLCAAGQGVKISVTAAKSKLRQFGLPGVHLASRVGKLSKAMNTDAHPDITLAKDIATLLATCGAVSDEGEKSTDVSESHDVDVKTWKTTVCQAAGEEARASTDPEHDGKEGTSDSRNQQQSEDLEQERAAEQVSKFHGDVLEDYSSQLDNVRSDLHGEKEKDRWVPCDDCKTKVPANTIADVNKTGSAFWVCQDCWEVWSTAW